MMTNLFLLTLNHTGYKTSAPEGWIQTLLHGHNILPRCLQAIENELTENWAKLLAIHISKVNGDLLARA